MLTILYSPQLTMLYFGNFTDVSQISPNFPQDVVQYTVRNMGPSTIFNASLTILLPFIVPNQQDRYYLYPFNITVMSFRTVCHMYFTLHFLQANLPQSISCNQSLINPENIDINARRRRNTAGTLDRYARQVAPIVNSANCQENLIHYCLCF